MLLRESMDAAVADVSADLTSLAVAARRQGLAIRRRRRALATVGAAAAAVLVAGGVAVALPGGRGDDRVASDPTPPGIVGPLSGVTAPITGPGVAAALVDAVDDVDVDDGTVTRPEGDVTRDPHGEASADLLLLPATGAGPAGRVMVNLQSLAMGGPQPYTCNDSSYGTRCTVSILSDGDTLRVYHDDGDTEFGADSQRAVAEVLSPARHLRVVVFAQNTNALQKGSFREQTVLDTDQLTEIATQPWWSRNELPQEYVDAGERLESGP